jgi:hypothetical protein
VSLAIVHQRFPVLILDEVCHDVTDSYQLTGIHSAEKKTINELGLVLLCHLVNHQQEHTKNHSYFPDLLLLPMQQSVAAGMHAASYLLTACSLDMCSIRYLLQYFKIRSHA